MLLDDLVGVLDLHDEFDVFAQGAVVQPRLAGEGMHRHRLVFGDEVDEPFHHGFSHVCHGRDGTGRGIRVLPQTVHFQRETFPARRGMGEIFRNRISLYETA